LTGLAEEMVARYASWGVLVDTNILLIYLAGLWDRTLVERFSRNDKGYTADDFDALDKLIARFQLVLTTPHILTEVSNLSNALGFKRNDPDAADHLARVVAFLLSTCEERVPKDTILGERWRPLLARFGVTDVSIMEACRIHRCLVLTDDAKLCDALGRLDVDVLNFSNIRFPDET
jgi:hypothetical protein